MSTATSPIVSPNPSPFKHTVLRIKCNDLDGRSFYRVVDAFIHDGAPGLALVMVRGIGWNITHAGTGMRITPNYRTRAPLEQHLLALAQLFPWGERNLPPAHSNAFHDLTQRIRALNASGLPNHE